MNSGGGLWHPPAVDANGDMYIAVANPAPWPGTKDAAVGHEPARAEPVHEQPGQARPRQRRAATGTTRRCPTTSATGTSPAARSSPTTASASSSSRRARWAYVYAVDANRRARLEDTGRRPQRPRRRQRARARGPARTHSPTIPDHDLAGNPRRRGDADGDRRQHGLCPRGQPPDDVQVAGEAGAWRSRRAPARWSRSTSRPAP